MFTVDLPSGVRRVRFHHEHYDPPANFGFPKPAIAATFCYLEAVAFHLAPAGTTDTGAATLTYSIHVSEHPEAIGRAVCIQGDHFSRKIGRKKALTRAIHRLPAQERASIWEAYKASGARL
jgi:hypothetical protein